MLNWTEDPRFQVDYPFLPPKNREEELFRLADQLWSPIHLYGVVGELELGDKTEGFGGFFKHQLNDSTISGHLVTVVSDAYQFGGVFSEQAIEFRSIDQVGRIAQCNVPLPTIMNFFPQGNGSLGNSK